MSPRKWSLLVLVLAGCASDPPGIPAAGNGALHQGTFAYVCSSPTDAQCGTAALPLGIAVDSDFGLHFEPTTPAATVLEPSTAFFTVDAGGHLHATRAGYGAVLVNDANGDVIDFVNLHVKTIASLTIDGTDPAAVGETRTLTAAAFDVANEPLAGGLTLSWESEDPDVATVTDDGTLHAIAAGTAHIRVIAGAATGAATIQVGGS